MLHPNDRHNRMKHAKMNRRLNRGIMLDIRSNSGEPNTSKIHPNCRWDRRRLERLEELENQL